MKSILSTLLMILLATTPVFASPDLFADEDQRTDR